MKPTDDGLYENHLCHCPACDRVRKAIRLDAWKQGMTDGAAICHDEFTGLASENRILSARDNKKELP